METLKINNNDLCFVVSDIDFMQFDNPTSLIAIFTDVYDAYEYANQLNSRGNLHYFVFACNKDEGVDHLRNHYTL